MSLILASQSPRRQQLLGQMGLSFQVKIADIDETMDPGLSAREAVAEVSARKARAVEAERGDVIVAADTIVVVDGRVLGKPHSEDEAKKMLRLLSGRTHQVMTGLTVRRDEKIVSTTEITKVTFREMSEREIESYVASGDPMDKAGSYGVQGLAAVFVSSLEGDYFNVMGLPLCALCPLLRQFGVEILGEKG